MGAFLCGLVGRATEELVLVPGLPPGNQGQTAGKQILINMKGCVKVLLDTCYCCRKLHFSKLRNKNFLAETGCARLGSSGCGVSSLLSFRNDTKALLEPLCWSEGAGKLSFLLLKMSVDELGG